MREIADIFKALADETRLQMLTFLLERDELCVCDFVGALDITQSKASRHLRYLYNCGLLADRRDGVWIHYRISPDLLPEARAILEVFHVAHTIVAGMGMRDHLAVRIVPRLIDRVEQWTGRTLQRPGIPGQQEILAEFLQPLLEQIRTDASQQVTSLA